MFSKFLATIKTDVPIQLDMDALKKEDPDEEELRRLFEMLEFRTLIDRVIKTEKRPPPHPLLNPISLAYLRRKIQATPKIQISRG